MPEPMPDDVAWLLMQWNNPYRDSEPGLIDLMKSETCWICGANCYTSRGLDIDGVPTERDSCLKCNWKSPPYFAESTLILVSTGYQFRQVALSELPASLDERRSLIAGARRSYYADKGELNQWLKSFTALISSTTRPAKS